MIFVKNHKCIRQCRFAMICEILARQAETETKNRQSHPYKLFAEANKIIGRKWDFKIINGISQFKCEVIKLCSCYFRIPFKVINPGLECKLWMEMIRNTAHNQFLWVDRKKTLQHQHRLYVVWPDQIARNKRFNLKAECKSLALAKQIYVKKEKVLKQECVNEKRSLIVK